jgi:aldehyde:ferredoxin oxidoreductase
VDPWTEKAIACDLCGGEPKCVPFCHASALKVTSYDEKTPRHKRQFFEECIKVQGLSLSPRLKGPSPQENLRGGKVLFVDLSNGKMTTEPTSTYAKDLVGARAISTKILYDKVPPGVDPLGEENVLALGVGPMVGAFHPGTVRTDIMAKSPLTGFLGESSLGGYFGAELKMAGFDHIIVRGKAQNPSYLYIKNDQVELKDAIHLWGKDCYELPKLIREELKEPRAQVLGIGPAGENKVAFASVHASLGNTAARTGMGAVLGSKNLKAIVARGSKGLKVADPEVAFALGEEGHRKVKSSDYYQEMHTHGSAGMSMTAIMPKGDPTWGWDKVHEVKTPLEFLKEHLYRKESCLGCPVACLEAYKIEAVGNGVGSCSTYIDFSWPKGRVWIPGHVVKSSPGSWSFMKRSISPRRILVEYQCSGVIWMQP